MRIIIIVFATLLACTNAPKQQELKLPDSAKGVAINFEFAKYIKAVNYPEGYKVIRVLNPWKKGAALEQYFLYSDTALLSKYDLSAYHPVKVPITAIVPLSTSFYGYLEKLGLLESIVGVENKNFVYNAYLLNRINKNLVLELGQSGNLSVERTIRLAPSLLIQSGSEVLSNAINSVRKAGIPVVQNLDWQEEHPLGRAEWIKFFALFYGKSALADSVFAIEKTSYLNLANGVSKEIIKRQSPKPSVLLGYNYQGTWYLPGGKSYVAQFMRDAGADYPYNADTTTGSIPLSYELVFAKMNQSDIWLHPGVCRSKQELLLLDNRYERLTAFKKGSIYNFTNRVTAAGGNDYWENGAANPSRVLKDLVQIFYPNLIPNAELYYYQVLR